MRHVLSILVGDRFGALSRIIELFSSRGFNLNSICSGSCEVPDHQRLTLVVDEDQDTMLKIIKLLRQIVDVIDAGLVDNQNSVNLELMIMRLSFERKNRVEIMNLIRGNNCTIVAMGRESVTFTHTGTAKDLDNMISIFRDFTIIELARTGEAAIHK